MEQISSQLKKRNDSETQSSPASSVSAETDSANQLLQQQNKRLEAAIRVLIQERNDAEERERLPLRGRSSEEMWDC